MFAHIEQSNPDAETLELRALLQAETAMTADALTRVRSAFDSGWEAGFANGYDDASAATKRQAYLVWAKARET